MIVPVVRLGKALEFVIDAKTLGLIEERQVESLADKAAARIHLPDGQVVNTVQVTGADGRVFTLAWPTLPPNRDLPQAQIPEPTDLVLLHDIEKGFR